MGTNSQAWNSALSGLGSSFEKVGSMNRQREQDRIAEEERARKTEHENAERAYIEEQRRKGDELAAAKQANTKAYYDKLAKLKSEGVQEEVKSETSSDYANAMGSTAPKHTRARAATEDDYLSAAIEHQQLGGTESEALARYFLNGKKGEVSDWEKEKWQKQYELNSRNTAANEKRAANSGRGGGGSKSKEPSIKNKNEYMRTKSQLEAAKKEIADIAAATGKRGMTDAQKQDRLEALGRKKKYLMMLDDYERGLPEKTVPATPAGKGAVNSIKGF